MCNFLKMYDHENGALHCCDVNFDDADLEVRRLQTLRLQNRRRGYFHVSRVIVSPLDDRVI